MARTSVPVKPGNGVGADEMRKSLAFLRRFFNLPSFIALRELLLAARTDPDLAATVRSVQKAIHAKEIEVILKLYPGWTGKERTLEVVHDAVQSVLHGIAMSQMTFLDKGRIERIESLLADMAFRKYMEPPEH